MVLPPTSEISHHHNDVTNITVTDKKSTDDEWTNSWEYCEQNATAFACSTLWYNVTVTDCGRHGPHEQERIIEWPIIDVTVFIQL